jgi:predicted nucleic acid-binding protein
VILVDTSVWIDHLRSKDELLSKCLSAQQIRVHPYVTGELACGHLSQRSAFLELMRNLPHAKIATHDEVLHVIESHGLAGFGLGYVDVHLLASVLLSGGMQLWTRDKRLKAAAHDMGIAFSDG